MLQYLLLFLLLTAVHCTAEPSTRNSSKWSHYIQQYENAISLQGNTSHTYTCGGEYMGVLESDLGVWRERGGIKREEFIHAKSKGVHYQIVNGKLYREKDCLFSFRCKGVEHFILNIIEDLPNMELIINVFDYPKSHKYHSPLPVFSFSKTVHYWDIMYPAWTFWSGGPAVSVEPTGLGRWDLKRISITKSAKQWPWDKKKSLLFFRGSRTSSERDSLILLSRDKPHLVDAAYTKNQAWRSSKDTLNAPPADEVKLEEHCQYKYLVNFRGVAASFRFKHLFLCHSVVFHVGKEWIEFFYPALKPWIHYVPLTTDTVDIQDMIDFVKDNDDIAKSIAVRGFEFVWNNLRPEDVECYWKRLLIEYSKLLLWTVDKERDYSLIS
ncbi:PREDICTED: protein O-glucosyltransferase 1-like isoform X2 [Amphimedon queenslandica]|uniref:Glycosyl transferase CAP10 domain-containing protein n=1 Tax=Amphimedon queenslandica TaxID=400682 RepID=A0A1X7VQF4_AMPQE|nr:PREDICTED: protein O-glucosyltransferase 1-like isoform X2 [Amphimedon queenslandica]|eukprot:XP_003383040.2 PREDICTED: protein O-glucosyltransferase 1-like isoform X2 [Amphimedon queenslandica]